MWKRNSINNGLHTINYVMKNVLTNERYLDKDKIGKANAQK
jgi:hypothetical protein